ncbi:uncharacterized protein G2W53_035214 [Senna tora]|uniref:Uncharacterized protein n=1 Tax=Senna tora TaxID=362788 RepID=A0A834SRY0_9FABA|nr:uncharacterized protein G2W53_035214 [Senna tora]
MSKGLKGESLDVGITFLLRFGEAMIHAKLEVPTLRVSNYEVNKNREATVASLDIAEELREQAQTKAATSRLRPARLHYTKIQPRHFKVCGSLRSRPQSFHLSRGPKPSGDRTGETGFILTPLPLGVFGASSLTCFLRLP